MLLLLWWWVVLGLVLDEILLGVVFLLRLVLHVEEWTLVLVILLVKLAHTILVHILLCVLLEMWL